MPNGHYHAQCRNCAFYAYRKRGRRCRQHAFVMPRVDEVVCADWRLREKEAHDKPWAFGFVPALLASDEFRSMRPDTLYYYHYFAAGPAQRLAPFESLQHLIWSASITDDPELGWVLLVGEGDYGLVPEPGTPLTLRLDNVPYRYEVAAVARERMIEQHRTPNGTWERTYDTLTQRILYSTDAPAALHQWLDARLDLAAYRAAIETHEFREVLRDAGINVFVANTNEAHVYRLDQVDGILYDQYQRHSGE